jgi:hypothetical protein
MMATTEASTQGRNPQNHDDEGTIGGGRRKDSMDDSSSPAESLRNSRRRRASSDVTVRGSSGNIGVIPTAEEEEGGNDNDARLLLPNTNTNNNSHNHNPAGRRGPPVRRENPREFQSPTGSSGMIPSSPHESLMPKPLAVVAQRGNSGRQKKSSDPEPTQSGWWGALASVIDRPQAAYDPSNVV